MAKHAIWVTLFALVIASGIGAAAPAGAAVRSCSVFVEVPNRTLSHAGVTSARNLSCRAARRAIRRYGRRQTRAPYGDAGARFRLGPCAGP